MLIEELNSHFAKPLLSAGVLQVLVACEESQAVTKELRKLGHEAFSCDLLPESGGHPEWHLQHDVTDLLKLKWDMIIAFPPCTYLTVTGNRWFNIERYGEQAIQRHKDREFAIKFFKMFADAACDCVIQFQKRLDYIFTNEADRQCEFDWWEGIKKEIQTIKYKP